jgi:hypothetical protein
MPDVSTLRSDVFRVVRPPVASQVRKADTQMIPDAAAGNSAPEEDEDDEDEGMMPDEEVCSPC